MLSDIDDNAAVLSDIDNNAAVRRVIILRGDWGGAFSSSGEA